MGANASGKTSLGRMMCKINNYLAGRPVEDTPSKICDKDSNASFEVTYITPETKEIHQLKAEFDKNGLFFESYRFCKLNKTDSLKKTLAKVGVYFYSAVPAFPQHQILTDQKSLTTLLINLH
jgi:ABC-type cobalamin/Fe3+-siderophores transport system ATPase subunit